MWIYWRTLQQSLEADGSLSDVLFSTCAATCLLLATLVAYGSVRGPFKFIGGALSAVVALNGMRVLSADDVHTWIAPGSSVAFALALYIDHDMRSMRDDASQLKSYKYDFKNI